MNKKILDDNKIINFYLTKPMSIKALSKQFNICELTAKKVLERNNISIYNRQDLNRGSLITNFFEKIDSEEKAYLLGLFIADGCIFINKYKNNSKLFTIELQESDSYMIKKIKDLIKAPRKIVIDKRKNESSISVTNNEFVEHLERHGMVNYKPNRFFPTLKEEMYKHFIRGYFNGDGSIYRRILTNRNPSWHIVFCGHDNIIYNIRNYLSNKLNIAFNKPSYEKGIFSVKWSSKKDVIALINYLYTDSTTYLFRKYEKAMVAVQEYNSRYVNTEINIA